MECALRNVYPCQLSEKGGYLPMPALQVDTLEVDHVQLCLQEMWERCAQELPDQPSLTFLVRVPNPHGPRPVSIDTQTSNHTQTRIDASTLARSSTTQHPSNGHLTHGVRAFFGVEDGG